MIGQTHRQTEIQTEITTLYIHVSLADQTAKPNWLKFFEGTLGYPGGTKKTYFFEIFESPRTTLGTAEIII